MDDSINDMNWHTNISYLLLLNEHTVGRPTTSTVP